MRAVQINSYGGPEVWELKDTQSPVPKENQILVEVNVSSINPFDVKLVSGMFKESMPLHLPFTPGGDVSGIVKEVGNNINDFKVGEEVFGSANIANGGSGSFAELAVANSVNLAYKPKTTDFLESAALTLVGASAVQAIEEHIKLQSNQKILIHGGAGGIGHMAIQIAKAIGAHVATTVSKEDMDFVMKLGADETIDYKSQKFEKILKEFDAVFDTVGGEVTKKSFKVLKEGGVLVSMVGQPNEQLAKEHKVKAIGQNTRTETDNLNRVATLADEGRIKVNIDKIFPLDSIKKAISYWKEISIRGKVVMKIK